MWPWLVESCVGRSTWGWTFRTGRERSRSLDVGESAARTGAGGEAETLRLTADHPAGPGEADHDAPSPHGRVKNPGPENFHGRRHVLPCMKPISEAHLSEPGLAVVDVVAADDETALAVQELNGKRRSE
ncbi:DUF6207 family protein [Streptomyces sp. Qhu-G9]|uniref:DUF6207 family protein n=1 Tax=Streptomyces sp. Qhu-G9 TaxID=3452799 RepID=UPI003AF6255F